MFRNPAPCAGSPASVPTKDGFRPSKILTQSAPCNQTKSAPGVCLRRCEKIQNRRRSGGRGSRRASWGKGLLGWWLAGRVALPIFSQLLSYWGNLERGEAGSSCTATFLWSYEQFVQHTSLYVAWQGWDRSVLPARSATVKSGMPASEAESINPCCSRSRAMVISAHGKRSGAPGSVG